MTTSYRLAADLHLVRQTLLPGAPVAASGPAHHLAVVDCSGSMTEDLPRIREQLKLRLPKLLREGDIFSLIWFSGRDQYGVVCEAIPIATLTALANVHDMIDKRLQPVGMTGFLQPIELAASVAEKGKLPVALLFLSDGADNQWPRDKVLSALEKTAHGVASTTIVAYGLYADWRLLGDMATRAGGSLIVAKDFDTYAPAFEAAMTREVKVGKRLRHKVQSEVTGGMVFTISDGEIQAYSTQHTAHEGMVSLPADVSEIAYLSAVPIGKVSSAKSAQDWKESAIASAYAAMALFATRMRPKILLAILQALGDVAFAELFAGCFGKQAYMAFESAAKAAALQTTSRFQKGYDANCTPREDCFTVLELMQILASDEDNRVLLDAPEWRYARIGRVREDGEEALGLKFTPTPQPGGYGLHALVYNEVRPNLCFRVEKEGHVDLSGCKGRPAKVPAIFPTRTWRTFAVVKDGIANLEKMPVMLTAGTWDKIEMACKRAKTPITPPGSRLGPVLFDLSGLPILNQRQVREVSAKGFFELEYALVKAQAAQKVYGAYQKELPGRPGVQAYAFLYGEEGAAWLKAIGLSEMGYHPVGQKLAEVRDVYMAKMLKVSLKGLSSLPSLKEAEAGILKVGGGKVGKVLPISVALMEPHIRRVAAFKASDVYLKAAKPEALYATWLETEFRSARAECRRLLREVAEVSFAIIVGQTWFQDLKDLDDNAMVLKVDGREIPCKAELVEFEESI